MTTSERSLRQPQGGGQDLWLSIHCWLQTWVPAPSPAIEGRVGVVRQREKEREAQRKIITSVSDSTQKEKRGFSAVI